MASTVVWPSTSSRRRRAIGGSSNHSRSSRATASRGTALPSIGQTTSMVPLVTSGASEGALAGGGRVARSLWRANSCGLNGGRTVARSLIGSRTTPSFPNDLGLRSFTVANDET